MMNHKRMRLTKLAFALSLALASAHGVAQNTTSAINGLITDASGQPAGGAQVTIVHAESGSVSHVTTDATGRYAARGLRPGGPYTITITKNGVTERRENVFINLAETANVDARLGSAAITTVTVTGQAGGGDRFSSSAMGTGTNISRTELAALASINRNLQDYARIDPRVAQTDKNRGEISVAGQNSRFNTITIDGVGITDTFGLSANGLPTLKQPISIDAIQSVQVNVSNYDVTQKGYTGGNINAVTKSGTNQFHGSLYTVYRDDSMAGDRYNRVADTFTAPPDMKERTNGFTLGGPIVKDKLFFFVSVEDFKSTRDSPSFGPLGSPLTNVGISQNAITQANAIAAARYPGLLVGTTDVAGSPQLAVRDKLVKLDWNISDDHRASLRYSKTDQRDPQFGSNTQTSLALSSQWRTDVANTKAIVGQIFSDWTENFSTELKVSKREFGKVPENNAYSPAIGLQFGGPLPAGTPSGVASGNRFLNFGTDQSYHYNILSTDTLDAYFGATWRRGAHEVKFGGDYAKNEVFNAFLQNINGNYTFSCVNAVLGTTPANSLTYTFNNGAALNCASATAEQYEAATLENFSRGRPSSYSVQIATPGNTLDNAVARFTLKNAGLFVQDTWTVSDRLNVNYGLRIDQQNIPETPVPNVAARAAVIPGSFTVNAAGVGTYVPATGGMGVDNTRTMDGKRLMQPRFGFNYRFESELPMQLRGGFGLFQGAAMNVWLGNVFSNPGAVTRTVSCSATGTPRCPNSNEPGIFNPDPTKQVTSFTGSLPAVKLDVLSPDLKQPAVWKANLGFEKQLPFAGIVFGLEYLRTDVKSALYYKHLNLGNPTRIGPDGRELYYTTQGYEARCYGATGTVNTTVCNDVRKKPLANLAYGDVISAENTGKGYGNVATVSLQRPLSKGWGWSAAYTFTDSKEVSNLSSSTSSSQWNTRSVLNPNEEVESNSAYLVRDRFTASLTWQKAFFGDYKTTIGAFYEGRKGRPYSWTFQNDMNGDNIGGNDLMYIPSAFGSGEVVFFGDTATSKANEQRFWDIVNAEPSLANHKGGVVGANSAFAPWTNTLDMRVSQEIPGFFKGHKGVFTLDFMNVGNMINKRWGHIEEMNFPGRRNFVAYAGMQDNKYVYTVLQTVSAPLIKQDKGESQWAIQATARYEF